VYDANGIWEKLIAKVFGIEPSGLGSDGGEEAAMASDQKLWLDEYAVTCRVFKGRWSIRHCLRMYNDIKDLKIHMSSRARGKVTRYESCYNPCERCKVLNRYIASLPTDENQYNEEEAYKQAIAV